MSGFRHGGHFTANLLSVIRRNAELKGFNGLKGPNAESGDQKGGKINMRKKIAAALAAVMALGSVTIMPMNLLANHVGTASGSRIYLTTPDLTWQLGPRSHASHTEQFVVSVDSPAARTGEVLDANDVIGNRQGLVIEMGNAIMSAARVSSGGWVAFDITMDKNSPMRWSNPATGGQAALVYPAWVDPLTSNQFPDLEGVMNTAANGNWQSAAFVQGSVASRADSAFRLERDTATQTDIDAQSIFNTINEWNIAMAVLGLVNDLPREAIDAVVKLAATTTGIGLGADFVGSQTGTWNGVSFIQASGADGYWFASGTNIVDAVATSLATYVMDPINVINNFILTNGYAKYGATIKTDDGGLSFYAVTPSEVSGQSLFANVTPWTVPAASVANTLEQWFKEALNANANFGTLGSTALASPTEPITMDAVLTTLTTNINAAKGILGNNAVSASNITDNNLMNSGIALGPAATQSAAAFNAMPQSSTHTNVAMSRYTFFAQAGNLEGYQDNAHTNAVRALIETEFSTRNTIFPKEGNIVSYVLELVNPGVTNSTNTNTFNNGTNLRIWIQLDSIVDGVMNAAYIPLVFHTVSQIDNDDNAQRRGTEPDAYISQIRAYYGPNVMGGTAAGYRPFEPVQPQGEVLANQLFFKQRVAPRWELDKDRLKAGGTGHINLPLGDIFIKELSEGAFTSAGMRVNIVAPLGYKFLTHDAATGVVGQTVSRVVASWDPKPRGFDGNALRPGNNTTEANSGLSFDTPTYTANINFGDLDLNGRNDIPSAYNRRNMMSITVRADVPSVWGTGGIKLSGIWITPDVEENVYKEGPTGPYYVSTGAPSMNIVDSNDNTWEKQGYTLVTGPSNIIRPFTAELATISEIRPGEKAGNWTGGVIWESKDQQTSLFANGPLVFELYDKATGEAIGTETAKIVEVRARKLSTPNFTIQGLAFNDGNWKTFTFGQGQEIRQDSFNRRTVGNVFDATGGGGQKIEFQFRLAVHPQYEGEIVVKTYRGLGGAASADEFTVAKSVRPYHAWFESVTTTTGYLYYQVNSINILEKKAGAITNSGIGEGFALQIGVTDKRYGAGNLSNYVNFNFVTPDPRNDRWLHVKDFDFVKGEADKTKDSALKLQFSIITNMGDKLGAADDLIKDLNVLQLAANNTKSLVPALITIDRFELRNPSSTMGTSHNIEFPDRLGLVLRVNNTSDMSGGVMDADKFYPWGYAVPMGVFDAELGEVVGPDPTLRVLDTHVANVPEIGLEWDGTASNPTMEYYYKNGEKVEFKEGMEPLFDARTSSWFVSLRWFLEAIDVDEDNFEYGVYDDGTVWAKINALDNIGRLIWVEQDDEFATVTYNDGRIEPFHLMNMAGQPVPAGIMNDRFYLPLRATMNLCGVMLDDDRTVLENGNTFFMVNRKYVKGTDDDRLYR